jgi:exopolysaccharide production repressor protein
MSILLFLRGLIGVLAVFAIATYAFTQSAWTTFVYTALSAVLIQIGYFVAILFLVWRPAQSDNGKRKATLDELAKAPSEEDQPTGNIARLRGIPRSRHP